MTRAEANGNSVLVCRDRQHTFAIDRQHVLGIERADRMTPTDGMLPVIGEVTAAGATLPVFGLHEVASGEPDIHARLVLLQAGTDRFALRVDQILPRAENALEQLAMPRLIGTTFFPHLVRSSEALIPLLEPAWLCAGEPAFAEHSDSPRPASRFRKANDPGRLLLIPLEATIEQERPWLAGLSEFQVEEILDTTPIFTVPNSAAQAKGIIGWRNGVIAVVDLAESLGLGTTTTRSKILVVSHPDVPEPYGLRIASGVRSVQLPFPHLVSQREFPGEGRHFQDIVEADSATIGLLNLASLLAIEPAMLIL